MKPGAKNWQEQKPGGRGGPSLPPAPPNMYSEQSMPKPTMPHNVDWNQIPPTDPRWHQSISKFSAHLSAQAPQPLQPYSDPRAIQVGPRNVAMFNAGARTEEVKQPPIGRAARPPNAGPINPFQPMRAPVAIHADPPDIIMGNADNRAEEAKQPPLGRVVHPARHAPLQPAPVAAEPVAPQQDQDVYQVPKEDLKCIICLDIYEVLLSDKTCGALLCEACASRITTCPNCRGKACFERNAYLDRLMSSMQIRCRCGQLVTKREITAHKRVCLEERIGCPAASCAQVAAMSRTEFNLHLAELHREEFMAAFIRQYPSNFP